MKQPDVNHEGNEPRDAVNGAGAGRASGGIGRRELFGRSLIKATAASMAAAAITRGATARRRTPAVVAPFFVQLFQRGGADGLTLLCPYDDDVYKDPDTRPNLKINPPPVSGPGDATTALHLQDPTATHPAFGIPKAMAPLEDVYKVEGKLAFVHACGVIEDNRSHFIMQDLMERAEVLGQADGLGWLARHLNSFGTPGALRALHFGNLKAASYKGDLGGVVPTSAPMEFAFPGDQAFKDFLKDTLYTYYGGQPLLQALSEDLEAEAKLSDPNLWANLPPIDQTAYPNSTLGKQFQLTAAMAKGLADLEMVSIDYDNITGQRWDSHDTQNPYDGKYYNLMNDMSQALRAFYDDMKGVRPICVLVMTEFGRTLHENSSLGTDHGRGGLAMVMGDNVNGGQIHGAWPGLGPTEVDDKGDMIVANDIRDVQAEIVDEQLGNMWQNVITDPNYVYPAGGLGIFG